MKIIWSKFAAEKLKEIFDYYKNKVSIRVAHKIKKSIFYSTKQLIKNPRLGQCEPLLENLGEGHRYIVSGNYKIIYREIAEGILITDVFDTRQNPIKLEQHHNSDE